MSTRPLLSVAPMMALTDRHFRYLARQLAPSALLYSEMVTAKAIIHGDRQRLLGKSPAEGDVVLQLGGDDPAELAAAAAIGEQFGYVEVNLNVGCPSERVASGNFGACLMAQPELVGRALAAMKSAVSIPVSVKHRIGIDDADAYADLRRFVDIVDEVSGGVVSAYTVHARKAWLKGLSPKENRTVPPLRYHDVLRLKSERPDLVIEINGGIATPEAVRELLRSVDGVMIGRAVYEDPTLLARLEHVLVAGARPAAVVTRRALVERMFDYATEQNAGDHRARGGVPLNAVTRHLLNLYKGVPGARAWRRTLTEGAHLPGAGPELLLQALDAVPEHVNAAPLVSPAASEHSAGSRGSVAERPQVFAGDDQVLDLVGALADAR